MQSKHLSEMSTHVNDAFDTATGLRDRGRLDSSIAVNEQKDLAQDRIDAFEKSELAHHLVTSAVNHAQSAAENAKKAVAIALHSLQCMQLLRSMVERIPFNVIST